MRGRKGPHRSQGHEAAMETFMNLGADEIDIRSIKGDFVVHNEKDDIWNKVSPPFCAAGGGHGLPHT